MCVCVCVCVCVMVSPLQSSKVAPVSSSEDDVLKKKARVRERQLAREREKQRNKLEEWKVRRSVLLCGWDADSAIPSGCSDTQTQTRGG